MTDDDRDRYDFKNHLDIVLGFSDRLIAEAEASDPRRGDVEEIHKAAAAALDLLARLFPDPSSNDPRRCSKMRSE